MRFTIDTQELNSGINTVIKAIGNRTTISILEGIYLEATFNGLLLRCTDLSLQIETILPAHVSQEGACVMPGRLFSELARRLPGEETEIYTEENTVYISSGRARTNMQSENPGEFHCMPPVKEEYAVSISQGTFKSMIRQCIFASAQDESKPILTGVLLEMRLESLRMVALDGYRLAIIEKPVKAAKDINIIIPAKTLAEAIKLFTDDDEVVHIAANRRFVVFSSRTYTVISRLIEGDFLDYKRVIPEGYHTRVTVDVRDFSNSIERASLIITERLKNPLRITFDGNITVRCQTTLGKVVDELDAEIEGEPVEIGFNNRYLLDALRYSRCDKLVFEVSGPLSPVKVLPKDGGDFLFLVLPVRFKND